MRRQYIILIAFVLLLAGYVLWDLERAAPAQAPGASLLQYSSEEGITFMYPDTYELSSHPGAAGEGDALVLLPAGYVPPQNGEGPPAITLGIFANPSGMPLEQWVRENPRSNFTLSSAAPVPTTVGGKQAVSYQHSGLYESDAVAVEYNGKIFLFEAGWITAQDAIRDDFKHIINSVTFN